MENWIIEMAAERRRSRPYRARPHYLCGKKHISPRSALAILGIRNQAQDETQHACSMHKESLFSVCFLLLSQAGRGQSREARLSPRIVIETSFD